MKNDLAQTLDQYLASLEGDRATLDHFLARHPECAMDVRALLELADQVHRIPQPTPSPAALADGKRRMLQALTEKKQRQVTSPGPFSRYTRWITVLTGEGNPPAGRRFAPGFRLALAVVPMLLVLVAAVVFLKPWTGADAVRTATLETMNGVVDILPAGGDTWHAAAVGAQIEAGDRVRTGASSAATLVFFDGSTTGLEAETELTIARLSSQGGDSGKIIVIHQWLGQTHNRVEPLLDVISRFEIETPAAVMTVRGTEFVLDVARDGTTSVVVVEGVVDVMAQEVVVPVRAGQATVAQPLQTPAPARPASASTPALEPTPTPTHLPPGLTRTPQPPGLTRTPQPPGLTRTPQPPGPDKTPQPPGLTRTPQPPGLTKTPQPPGLTRTPQPPGLTRTPQPPGLTKTPQPPVHPTQKPKPAKPAKKPKPDK